MDFLEKLERLCDLAADIPRKRWSDLLDLVCEDDSELRHEALSLFDNLAADSGFLERPLISLELPELARFLTQVPKPPETVPERRIGNYRIDGILGRGGMAIIYDARQRSPDRQVALKLLYPGPITPHLARRFQREIELMGRLQHPGIVQVFEAGIQDVPAPEGGMQRLPFIAMERVDGPRLDDYLEQTELSIRQRLELFVQVCEAVDHAHSRGVLHRDLKPSNIVIDEHGHPKLIDFGIARPLFPSSSSTPLTTTGQILGSLPYLSPEQLQGGPNRVDQRSDIYSLGIILFEMLTGRPPFDIDHLSLAEAATVLATTTLPSLDLEDTLLSEPLGRLVARALAPVRAQRYRRVSELRRTLQRALRQISEI